MSTRITVQFVVLRGGNLTYNGDPRVGKLTFENLKMSNFPWVARPPHPPILGQTIDRCIKRRKQGKTTGVMNSGISHKAMLIFRMLHGKRGRGFLERWGFLVPRSTEAVLSIGWLGPGKNCDPWDPQSPQSADFPSLCAYSRGLFSVHAQKIGPSQRSQFLVLTKRSKASGDENKGGRKVRTCV